MATKNSDWYPHRRDEIISMAEVWKTELAADTEPGDIPAPEATATATAKQLPYYAFVTGGKLVLDLEGESGRTIYLRLRYENVKAQGGPFGPVTRAVAP
ncbi:MAG: hypothetical protein LBG84_00775 [Treponema sp.]|jgi:hypothetical protein|nr:hypothetical protein [Treponema sp.]